MAKDENDEKAGNAAAPSVRVDKWLWAARCFKTRSQSTEACTGGHVQVNDRAAKASQSVKVGDRVEVVTPGGRRILVVKGLGERRGPASVAQELFDDLTPPPPPKEPEFEPHWEPGGRPTKRDRRQLRKLKGDPFSGW